MISGGDGNKKKQRQREKRAQDYNPELTVVAVAEITQKAAIKAISNHLIVVTNFSRRPKLEEAIIHAIWKRGEAIRAIL